MKLSQIELTIISVFFKIWFNHIEVFLNKVFLNKVFLNEVFLNEVFLNEVFLNEVFLNYDSGIKLLT